MTEERGVIEKRREVIYERSADRMDRAGMARLTTPNPATLLAEFRDTFEAEKQNKNHSADEDSYLAHARVRALDLNVAGLALSGGGIRSATFAVGFFQGLAGLKLLRFFDVLSTVSGGGYAGGWLATWIRREGDPINVELQLDPNRVEQKEAHRGPELTDEKDAIRDETRLKQQVVDEEPEPIRHLRRYSSYMNPQPGLLSADTWTLVAIYVRNVLINLLVLLPVVLTVVLSIRLLLKFYDWVSLSGNLSRFVTVFFVGVVASLVAFCLNAAALYRLASREKRQWVNNRIVFLFEVLPLLGAAVALSMTYQPILDMLREPIGNWLMGTDASQFYYLDWPNVCGHAFAFSMLALIPAFVFFLPEWWKSMASGSFTPLSWLWTLMPSFGSGATMGVMVALTEAILRPAVAGHSTAVMALVGPPLLLLDAVVAIAALVALSGPGNTEPEREWWSRIAALLMLTVVAWVVLLGVVLFGPLVVLGSHQVVGAVLASGWVGITAAGVRAGGSATTSSGGGSRGLELVALAAPSVFLIGLLAVVSTLVVLGVDQVSRVSVQPNLARACAAYLYAIQRADAGQILRLMIPTAIATAMGLVVVNVNLFSLHAMYANRLTRAFLGASMRRGDWGDRWKPGTRAPWASAFRDQRVLAGAPTGALQGGIRNPNPVTQFDPDDDIDLVELAVGAGDDHTRYWGPLVIFNTALNLVGGDELAWRDRKAESFALTPIFSGSKTTGYARTSAATRGQLTVGRAVAVSGAAVDPNMNYHQSASVTALLTIFNARLGVWLQNPNRGTWPAFRGSAKEPRPSWTAGGPSYGGLLFHEILGLTDQKQKFVHLSDGGHFDNLGVYELIKRRCRYIVAVDATENPSATSDNLGTLVRLCRVDFGIRIQLDTAPLKVDGPGRYSKAHVVIGRVRYDDVDHGQTPGILIYVKSTMTGDEPSDVQQYANLHPEFPRQLTLTDQSFDEDQFESYRTLGEHVATSVFEVAGQALLEGRSMQEWFRSSTMTSAATFAEAHRKIFSALRNRWAEPPVVRDADRIESSRIWVEFQQTLRTSPELAEFDRDLYSDLPALADPVYGPALRSELHATEQALQMMADTWEGLGLRGRHDAPINRGWMNAFRRLSGSEAFRRFWPLLRSEFGADFVRFCERQLGAQVDEPELIPAAGRPDLVAHLGREFAREWPGRVGRDRKRSESLAEAGARYLRERFVDKAQDISNVPPPSPAAWLIVQYPIGYESKKEPPFEIPLGLLALVPDQLTPDTYELLLWVSRAQRSNGLGEKVRKRLEMADLIDWLSDKKRTSNRKKTKTVRVKYPPTPGADGEDLNRVRWLGFFSLLGFKPEGRPLPGQTLVLSKTYP